MFGTFLSNQNFATVLKTLQRLFHSLKVFLVEEEITLPGEPFNFAIFQLQTLNLFSNTKELFKPTFDHNAIISVNSISFCVFYREDTQTL